MSTLFEFIFKSKETVSLIAVGTLVFNFIITKFEVLKTHFDSKLDLITIKSLEQHILANKKIERLEIIVSELKSTNSILVETINIDKGISYLIQSYILKPIFIIFSVIPKEVVDETAMEAIKTSIKTVVLPALAALADFFKLI